MLPPQTDVENTETSWAGWNQFNKETSWKAFFRLLVCESGCSTRWGVSCVVHCKNVCVAVSWAKLSVWVRHTFSLFTMNYFFSWADKSLFSQTSEFVNLQCLGLRPFIVPHFNAIVLSFCGWLWTAVVVHLPVLSLYWADYRQQSCCVFRQVKFFT